MHIQNSLLKKYALICWPLSIEKAQYLILGVLATGFFFLNTSHHRFFLYILLFLSLFTLKRPNFADPLLKFASLFLALHCFSALWSINDDIEEYWRAIKVAPIIFLTILICLPLKKQPLSKLYAYAAAITGVILIIANISLIWDQYILSTEKSIWRLAAYGRGENENIAGALYAVSALLFLYIKMRYRWPCFAIVATILLLTLSRGAIIAFLGSAIITTIITNSGLISNKRLLLLCLPLILTPFIFPDIFQYMVERGTTGRNEIWAHSINYFLQSPLIGHGAANGLEYEITAQGRTYNHTHNVYLATLNDTGIIGLLILIGMISLMIFRSYKIKNRPLLSIVLFGTILGLVDLGGFYTSLGAEWVIFWFPLISLIRPTIHDNESNKDNA